VGCAGRPSSFAGRRLSPGFVTLPRVYYLAHLILRNTSVTLVTSKKDKAIVSDLIQLNDDGVVESGGQKPLT